MLEILREYALERLEASAEAALVRSWHAQYYIALAEAAEPELGLQDQLTWINRLDQEHDNIRAVLDWLLSPGSDHQISNSSQLALRLSGSLWRFSGIYMATSQKVADGWSWRSKAAGAQAKIPITARLKPKLYMALVGWRIHRVTWQRPNERLAMRGYYGKRQETYRGPPARSAIWGL